MNHDELELLARGCGFEICRSNWAQYADHDNDRMAAWRAAACAVAVRVARGMER